MISKFNICTNKYRFCVNRYISMYVSMCACKYMFVYTMQVPVQRNSVQSPLLWLLIIALFIRCCCCYYRHIAIIIFNNYAIFLLVGFSFLFVATFPQRILLFQLSSSFFSLDRNCKYIHTYIYSKICLYVMSNAKMYVMPSSLFLLSLF